MKLKAFWYYFGGKCDSANRYPSPKFDTIIEPFAGAAGYSLYHAHHKVILIDKYHKIAEIWKYLIKSSYEDIMRIKEGPINHIDELGDVSDAVKWLVGFHLNSSTTSPAKSLTAGFKRMQSGHHKDGHYIGNKKKNVGWTPVKQLRIAEQVEFIKKWEAIEGDYWEAPDIEATWYIDPPYQKAGCHYREGSKNIDYQKLGDWCKSRKGQVIVCEASGADWLPFRPFSPTRASHMVSGYKDSDLLSHEVIWTNENIEPKWKKFVKNRKESVND